MMENVELQNVPGEVYLNIGDIFTADDQQIDFRSLCGVSWSKSKEDPYDLCYVALETYEKIHVRLKHTQNKLAASKDLIRELKYQLKNKSNS